MDWVETGQPTLSWDSKDLKVTVLNKLVLFNRKCYGRNSDRDLQRRDVVDIDLFVFALRRYTVNSK